MNHLKQLSDSALAAYLSDKQILSACAHLGHSTNTTLNIARAAIDAACEEAAKLRSLTILCFGDGTFNVIDEKGRMSGELGWDEMLAQITYATIPKLGREHLYAMRTPEAIELRRKVVDAKVARTPAPSPVTIEAITFDGK